MAPIPKPASLLASPLAPPAPPLPRTPFPTAACGPDLEPAIIAAAARTQAPVDLIAHHLLMIASMATQRLADIRLPTGRTQPLSNYFLTIVGSGEGRSAADAACVEPVRFWQPQVVAPGACEIKQVFLTPRPSSGRDRYAPFVRSRSRSGLIAGVAADLLTPWSARRNEAESLSALWDGVAADFADDSVDSDNEDVPVPPRLSVHLVATAGEGFALLRAPEVADSGLLGRLLAVQPASRIGARVFSEADDAPPPELEALHDLLTGLYVYGGEREPRVIALDEHARRAWFTFAQETEAAIAAGGAFAPIRALAGHLAEHAARLAAVIALVEDDTIAELTPDMLDRGIALARFYAAEALRLSEVDAPVLATKEPLAALQSWLERRYAGAEVSLRDVYCFGPGEIRSASVALRAMRQLEMLGLAEGLPIAEAGRKGRRWRILTPGEAGGLQHTAA